jgi:hypothetical protein
MSDLSELLRASDSNRCTTQASGPFEHSLQLDVESPHSSRAPFCWLCFTMTQRARPETKEACPRPTERVRDVPVRTFR